MSKKLSIEEVREVFKINGLELLSDNYISCRDPLDYKCSCGRVAKMALNNVRKGKKCKACGIEKRRGAKRLKEKDVFFYIKSRGFSILSDEYKNAASHLKLKCPEGHIFNTSYRSFKNSKYGCRKCYVKKNSGKNHHSYKHGMSKEYRLDRNKSKILNNAWKRKLLKRYGYQCDLCDGKNNLIGHHKDGYNWCIDRRYDVDNGVILCKRHHDSFHKQYGKGDNTNEQYRKFRNYIKNYVMNPWRQFPEDFQNMITNGFLETFK